MRLWPASSAACEKLVKERVTPGSASEPSLKAIASVPKKSARSRALEPLKVLWPEV